MCLTWLQCDKSKFNLKNIKTDKKHKQCQKSLLDNNMNFIYQTNKKLSWDCNEIYFYFTMAQTQLPNPKVIWKITSKIFILLFYDITRKENMTEIEKLNFSMQTKIVWWLPAYVVCSKPPATVIRSHRLVIEEWEITHQMLSCGDRLWQKKSKGIKGITAVCIK